MTPIIVNGRSFLIQAQGGLIDGSLGTSVKAIFSILILAETIS